MAQRVALDLASCAVDGCDRRIYARGVCHRHYDAARRSGPKPAGPTTTGDAVSDGGWCSLWPARHQRPSGELELIAEIIKGSVRLPDVRCARTPAIFDIDAGEQCHRLAIASCRRCMARQECLEWALAQPAGIVSGIVGGRTFESGRW